MVVQDSDGTFFRESNSIKFHFNLHEGKGVLNLYRNNALVPPMADKSLNLVLTCPKNRNSQRFLRFPDTGILRTAKFTLIRRIVVFTGSGVETMICKFYHLKFVLKMQYLKFVLVSKNCKAFSSMSGQRSPDRVSLSSYKFSNTTLTLLLHT